MKVLFPRFSLSLSLIINFQYIYGSINPSLIILVQDALKAYELVFDAVYTPRNTRLLQEAKDVGACVVSGIEMFIRQALGQFRLFTGGLGINLRLEPSVSFHSVQQILDFLLVFSINSSNSMYPFFNICSSRSLHAQPCAGAVLIVSALMPRMVSVGKNFPTISTVSVV